MSENLKVSRAIQARQNKPKPQKNNKKSGVDRDRWKEWYI